MGQLPTQSYSVREPAWHGLSIVKEYYPGRDEAMMLAGHGFRVIEREIQTVAPEGKSTLALPGFKALIRHDNGVALSVMKDSYGTIQNNIPWDVIDSLVTGGSGAPVQYETGGIFDDGQVLWVLARLDEPVEIAGDDSPSYPYIFATWSHDGTVALLFSTTMIRIVCWNTLQMALRDAEARVSLRHSKHAMERTDEIKQAVHAARNGRNAFVEMSNELAAHEVSDDGVKDFILGFLPEPDADLITPRVRKNIDDNRTELASIIAGPTVPEAHKRTGYGLFQAGVEYLDHYRAFRSPETYFKRTVRPDAAKTQLQELVLSVN